MESGRNSRRMGWGETDERHRRPVRDADLEPTSLHLPYSPEPSERASSSPFYGSGIAPVRSTMAPVGPRVSPVSEMHPGEALPSFGEDDDGGPTVVGPARSPEAGLELEQSFEDFPSDQPSEADQTVELPQGWPSAPPVAFVAAPTRPPAAAPSRLRRALPWLALFAMSAGFSVGAIAVAVLLLL